MEAGKGKQPAGREESRKWCMKAEPGPIPLFRAVLNRAPKGSERKQEEPASAGPLSPPRRLLAASLQNRQQKPERQRSRPEGCLALPTSCSGILSEPQVGQRGPAEAWNWTQADSQTINQ